MNKTNLADKITERLPAGMVALMRAAGKMAERRQQQLYLVGGVVRDLLLERRNLDLDMVLEGDAIALAGELARTQNAEVTTHHRFGTAKLKWDGGSSDLATARAETYAHPGALPKVGPGDITSDLARRDFTVNAMAVNLNEGRFGELLDPHDGRQDLNNKYIRVLHDQSFTDDATRIWRALRYEQRLGFKIEPATLRLLEQDIPMLDTISGDRIRHEVERILGEERPEKALRRAYQLGVLTVLHPSLRGDRWLAGKFARARTMNPSSPPPATLYLSLLAYRLNPEALEQFIAYLNLPGTQAQALRDTNAVKGKMAELEVAGQAPSHIYKILHGHNATALTAVSIATGSPTAAEHVELYLNVLRQVQPILTGEDLKKMGVPAGPKIKEILQSLREAKLDGRVSSRGEEEKIVTGLI
jgi:tRNA nucleotidyltransferase (CCA-adding enzyme)